MSAYFSKMKEISDNFAMARYPILNGDFIIYLLHGLSFIMILLLFILTLNMWKNMFSFDQWLRNHENPQRTSLSPPIKFVIIRLRLT